MRPILLFSVAIVIVAVMAPKFAAHYLNAPQAASASAAPVAAEGDAQQASADSSHSGPRQVEIKAQRDGHFYVDAEINFQPVRLMVDTGATVVALRESDAAAAGIHVHPGDFVNPVQTANGTTNAAEATLESVSVNDIEVRNVRALIIPDEQLSLSLLGGSFLHSLDRFEVEGGTLIIEN